MRTDTDTKAMEALINGLALFQKTMINKPYDQAIFLIVALKEAGLKIVKAPKKGGK